MSSTPSTMPIKIRNLLKMASMFNQDGCHKYMHTRAPFITGIWTCDKNGGGGLPWSMCNNCFVQSTASLIELVELGHMIRGQDGCYYIGEDTDSK